MPEVDRKPYPQNVTDEGWSFVLPYLLLSRADSLSRRHSLRELFNGVRYIVRTGNQWRFMPNDLPPWPAVYQQMRRWMEAGVFEILIADLQALLRHFGGGKSQPTAICIDSAPCRPRRRAVGGPATTEPNVVRGRRSTLQSTR